MMEHILSVSHLQAGYKNNLVIHDISFGLKKGQVVGLVGLNGAGKTTLIKTLVGLREASGGRIDKKSNRSAFLPERFEAPAFLTGFEYIQFSLRFYNQTILKEKAEEVAQSISLDKGALHRRIKTYSKGMRQKIGVLATMLSHAPLKILDEPMSGLDPKARYEMKDLIKQAAQRGDSILMSSHVLADVHALCEEVIVIHQGTLLFNGTPLDLMKEGGDDDIEAAFLSVIGENKSKKHALA